MVNMEKNLLTIFQFIIMFKTKVRTAAAHSEAKVESSPSRYNKQPTPGGAKKFAVYSTLIFTADSVSL